VGRVGGDAPTREVVLAQATVVTVQALTQSLTAVLLTLPFYALT
jgi:hypothetical protein